MALLYASIALLLGVAAGRFAWEAGWLNCAHPGWLWLAPALLLAALPALSRRLHRHRPAPPLRWPASAGFRPPRSGVSGMRAALLLLVAATGALRYAAQPLTPCFAATDLAYYNLPADQAFARDAPAAVVSGYVDNFPLHSAEGTELILAASEITTPAGTFAVQGRVRLKLRRQVDVRYGQQATATGRLTTPPDFEDFSYREYLARKEIHSVLNSPRFFPEPAGARLLGNPLLRLLYGVRARGEAFLLRGLPEPYAGLAAGILLGIQAGIPDDLYEQFNATGSSHVIVISGSNVALVAGIITGVAGRLLGRRRALLPVLAGIALYVLLVGGDAAVLRAGVMGALVALAAALDRRSTALVSLAFACAMMVLLNPPALWDVGLQLSSSATAGLILFQPPLSEAYRRFTQTWGHRLDPAARWQAAGRQISGFFNEGLVVTLAASISTLPLVIFYFGRLSAVSLLTNVLILPLQPLIMLGGSAALVAGLLAGGWATPLLWLPWLGLAWTVGVVEWTADLPGASLEIAGYGVPALVLTYIGLAIWRWGAPLRAVIGRLRTVSGRLRPGRLVSGSALAGLSMATILLWHGALAAPDGYLHLWFLDIGQGDGILVQTPAGRQLLIDGGADPALLLSELGAVMPFYDRTLDVALLTHQDTDHMGGQSGLPRRMTIGQAIDTVNAEAAPELAVWRQEMTAAGTAITQSHAGGWLDLGNGVALWVLWPPPEPVTGDNADNENSLVTRLVYGNFSALLTGDAGIPTEKALIAAGAPLASTVLKVGHHGSEHSSSAAFLRAVAPALAVIQVGTDNDYGHPHQAVLAALTAWNPVMPVLRTDQAGRIHLWTDGEKMWVETEQGATIFGR